MEVPKNSRLLRLGASSFRILHRSETVRARRCFQKRDEIGRPLRKRTRKDDRAEYQRTLSQPQWGSMAPRTRSRYRACFVKHQANVPSGGHTAEIEIGVFLNQGHGPEHQELLRLIGTLVEEPPPKRAARKTPSTATVEKKSAASGIGSQHS